MQFKVNFFEALAVAHAHTTHTHTPKHANKFKLNYKFWNIQNFAIFSFVLDALAEWKHRNRTERGRRDTERATAANFVVRAPKLNWLQTQPARFTQAARMLHSIHCHSSRTSRFALQSNRVCESEHVACVHKRTRPGLCVWSASYSSSFRIPFVAQTCLPSPTAESSANRFRSRIECFIA